MSKFKSKVKDCQLLVKAELGFKERVREGELQLLQRQNIQGLLKVKDIGRRSVEYSGPQGISLADRLKEPVSREDFFFIIEQFVNIFSVLSTTPFSINDLVIDFDYIYINQLTKQLQFIFFPMEGKNETVNPIEVLNKVIYSTTNFEGDGSYIQELFFFIRDLARFDVNKIENYITSKGSNAVYIIHRHNGIKPAGAPQNPREFYDNMPVTTRNVTRSNEVKIDEDDDTMVLFDETSTNSNSDEDDTVLLEEEVIPKAVLKRTSTGEEVTINKKEFFIGKERENSDYRIENPAVSRKHAKIIIRENKFFIVDQNSKNHTFINGRQITPEEEVEIKDGDQLKLANELFAFIA